MKKTIIRSTTFEVSKVDEHASGNFLAEFVPTNSSPIGEDSCRSRVVLVLPAINIEKYDIEVGKKYELFLVPEVPAPVMIIHTNSWISLAE